MSYPPVPVRRSTWRHWANLQAAAGLHSFLESLGNPSPCFFQLSEATHVHWLMAPFLQHQSQQCSFSLTLLSSASDHSQERSAVLNNSCFYSRPKWIIQDIGHSHRTWTFWRGHDSGCHRSQITFRVTSWF